MTDRLPDASDAPSDTAEGRSEVVPEYSAKQGRRGLHMLGVLVASLVLIVAAFGTLYTLHAHTPRDATPAAAAANTRAMAS